MILTAFFFFSAASQKASIAVRRNSSSQQQYRVMTMSNKHGKLALPGANAQLSIPKQSHAPPTPSSRVIVAGARVLSLALPSERTQKSDPAFAFTPLRNAHRVISHCSHARLNTGLIRKQPPRPLLARLRLADARARHLRAIDRRIPVTVSATRQCPHHASTIALFRCVSASATVRQSFTPRPLPLDEHGRLLVFSGPPSGTYNCLKQK